MTSTILFSSFLLITAAILDISGSIPITQNVLSELIMVENPMAMQFNNKITTTQNDRNQFKIPNAAGGALDLFYRYGFFSLSVRVVPRDDPGRWLVREPTAKIFQKNSITERQEIRSMTFEPYFQVYLCDDKSELLEAYFKDFKADGVDIPHQLYSGSWRTSTMAKYMGLSPDSLDGESSFVLVKMNKVNRVVRIEGNPQLLPSAQESINRIQQGNEESVLDFVHKFGSHYIKEIALGESIYQVFALDSIQYQTAKRALSGSNRINSRDFAQIFQETLAPWVIRETGKIKSASGDFAVQRFLDVEPKIVGKFGSYPDIFQFQTNPTLLTKLEGLTSGPGSSEAVIGLQFASLRFLVPSISSREYYDQVVQTQIALWSSNI